MDYRILLRFFLRRFDWLQGDRGGVSFEVKASQKPFEKRGGGNWGSERSQSGSRGTLKES